MGETTNPPEGVATSQGKEGSTSTPETFTREQVEKEVSDRLAKTGRTAKALEDRGKALEARETKLSQWEKVREDEELEKARQDPDRLSIYQEKKAIKDAHRQLDADRAAFEKERTEHAEAVEEANATKREVLIWDIAGELHIDANELKELANDLSLQTPEQIKRVAKGLSGGKIPSATPKPDSGKTTGGGIDINTLTPRQQIQRGLEKQK